MPETKKQIFLDMDGVIANFLKQACFFHGRPYKPEAITKFSIPELWGISAKEFWAPLRGEEFWSGIEPYSYAKEFHAELSKIAPVTICTSPSNDAVSITGKLQWLKDSMGLNMSDVIFCQRKYKVAGPGKILIDDRREATVKFRANGGQAFLFSQPWNRNRRSYDWEQVVEELSK